jgi:hypothetical protein
MSIQDTVQSQSASSQGTFQYSSAPPDECPCPIHQSDGRPFTAPLGYRFAGDVEARPIPESTARAIYDAHHSYMSGSEMHSANIEHHGIYYRGNLVGAVTYRAPLGRRRLDWNGDGDLVARPASELKLDELPSPVSDRAKRFIDAPTEDEIARSEVFGGTEIMELNRICIGVDMPNLASCGLARSQDRFLQSSNCPSDTEFFLTLVRADFDASMIKALADRGWTLRSVSEPTKAGNREHKTINDEYKWVYVCPIDVVEDQQQTLTDW